MRFRYQNTPLESDPALSFRVLIDINIVFSFAPFEYLEIDQYYWRFGWNNHYRKDHACCFKFQPGYVTQSEIKIGPVSMRSWGTFMEFWMPLGYKFPRLGRMLPREFLGRPLPQRLGSHVGIAPWSCDVRKLGKTSVDHDVELDRFNNLKRLDLSVFSEIVSGSKFRLGTRNSTPATT